MRGPRFWPLAIVAITALGAWAALYIIIEPNRTTAPRLIAGTWEPPGDALRQLDPTHWAIGDPVRFEHWSDLPVIEPNLEWIGRDQ